jgi:hypothetical protein
MDKKINKQFIYNKSNNMSVLNKICISLNFHNSLNKSNIIQDECIPLRLISKLNRTAKILVTILIMAHIVNIGAAQDSIRTQNIPDYYGDVFQKRQLSLGVFWRNFLTDGIGKWGAGLNYKLIDGTSSEVHTIGLAAHLIFNITPCIGIVTGLEIANYSGKAAGNFEGYYRMELDNGIPDAIGNVHYIDFSYKLRDYSEQQKLALLSVPVMVKYSTSAFSDINAKYFVALGFKFRIPLIDRTTIDPGYVSTSGYFSREMDTYPAEGHNFPEHGFVTSATGFNAKNKIGIKPGVSLALETGVTFMSSEDINAAASIYYDLGLGSMLRRGNKHMVEYYPDARDYEHLGFNSIMRTDRANSVIINSLGLKLIVNFNLDKKTK